MAKMRSPNFPVVDLQGAVDAVTKIYSREKRGRFPKEAAAKHLGYTSINGRSLGLLAALRAYGLLEGRGDDLVVSHDAVAIMEAPDGSVDRTSALDRAFHGPTMFERIIEQYPQPPSGQTLKWWLIQQGFASEGADKAADVFLSSHALVARNQGAYGLISNVEQEEELAEDPKLRAAFHGAAARVPAPPKRVGGEEGMSMGVQERILQSGMLSKAASYRVIVSGPVGESELNRLIAKLEMDKEILSDPEPGFTDPATGGVRLDDDDDLG